MHLILRLLLHLDLLLALRHAFNIVLLQILPDESAMIRSEVVCAFTDFVDFFNETCAFLLEIVDFNVA